MRGKETGQRDEMWFVGCVQHEGVFEVYGPLWSEDDALLEAGDGTDCDNRHLISRRVPPSGMQVWRPALYAGLVRGHESCISWAEQYDASVAWLRARGQTEVAR